MLNALSTWTCFKLRLRLYSRRHPALVTLTLAVKIPANTLVASLDMDLLYYCGINVSVVLISIWCNPCVGPKRPRNWGSPKHLRSLNSSAHRAPLLKLIGFHSIDGLIALQLHLTKFVLISRTFCLTPA